MRCAFNSRRTCHIIYVNNCYTVLLICKPSVAARERAPVRVAGTKHIVNCPKHATGITLCNITYYEADIKPITLITNSELNSSVYLISHNRHVYHGIHSYVHTPAPNQTLV